MTTSTTTRETQIAIAYEVLMMDETGKTKADIAKEFEVSPRSVTRYAEKYEDEAMDLLTEANESEETIELKEAFAPKVEDTQEASEEPEEVEADVQSAEEIEEPESESDDLEASPEVEEEETQEEEVELKEFTPQAEFSLEEIKEEDFYEDLNDNQKKLLADFYAQKAEATEVEDRKGKRGRAKKGVKSIRFIVMEVIESHKAQGTLTKENRQEIINQIVEATGHDEKQAKKYFSGYKKVFGGWNK